MNWFDSKINNTSNKMESGRRECTLSVQENGVKKSLIDLLFVLKILKTHQISINKVRPRV